MAQDKGKNIVTEPAPAPPMKPPPTLFPIPFGEHRHRCDGDGCASDPDTWPLHHVIRGGQHCRLCCSCVLLSLRHRSLYCCHCFFLVTKSWSEYDVRDTLMAPPAPIITCVYCGKAVAHLPCLYPEQVPVVNGHGVFLCPPCTAVQNGSPFTYAPPCKQPLEQRDARVLLLAGRIAVAELDQHATAARAAAERMALVGRDAKKRADEALSVAYELAKKEDPSWVLPQSPENDLTASEEEEEEDIEAEANDVGEVLLARRRNAMPMPSLATLTIGAGSSRAVPMAKHTPPSSQSQPKLPFDLNKNADENDLNENAAANEAGAVQAGTALNSFSLNNVPLNSLNVREVAMAAAEAARASLPTSQALHLFPSTKASSSTKKPRTKRPRTMQLFKDGKKKM